MSHIDHLWRRPTIPLVSRAPEKFPFLDDRYSPDIARYWHDDFRKSHFHEVFSSDADVLVFDITRDVFCRVFEMGDLSYVIDPMSVKGIVWNNDNIDEAKISQTIGREYKPIGFTDDIYFEIWKFMFDVFAEHANKFERIILNRIYFTEKLASQNAASFGDASYVSIVNEFLDRAYDYIRENHKRIMISTVPRKLLISGLNVNWGGPTYTHFISEATSMYAENIRKLIFGEAYVSGEVFIKKALIRAKQHEDLARAHQANSAELETVVRERDALRGSFAEAEGERERLSATLGHTFGELEAIRGRFVEVEGQRDHLAVRLDVATGERDAFQARQAEIESRRDNLTAELSVVTSGRDILQNRLIEIEGQRNRLAAELAAMVGERDVARSRIIELEAERDHRAGEMHAMTGERDALGARLSEAEGYRDQLAAELGIVGRERDELRGRLAEAEGRHSHSAAELGVAAGERDGLRARLSEVEERYDLMVAKLDAMMNERDALRVRMTEVEAHRDRLAAQLPKAGKLSFLRL